MAPCDRPPKYIVEGVPAPRRSIYDTSDARQPLNCAFKGKRIENLKGIHSGKVALLFNGRSLADHDLNKITCPIIGMNRTHKGFPGYNGPQPDYLCVIDIVPWLDTPGVLEHPCVINGSTDRREIGYRIARSFRMAPFSFDLARDGYVPPVPCTTGHMALQLAVYMGFTEIHCLGLDMGGPHFDGTKSSHFLEQANRYHTRQAKVLKERGITVKICGSPDSKCKAFEHSDFSEVCN